jgi:hypothetical protein
VLARLGPAARSKTYLGYSDAGYMLAGLYRAGFADLAHGPMPQDIRRDGGDAAVTRALSWLSRRDAAALEPGLGEAPAVAFNITVFSQLLGTPLEPDLAGHMLMLEDVSEHMYRTDRSLFHVTGNRQVREVMPESGSGGAATCPTTIPISAPARRKSSVTGASAPASPIWAAPTSATTPTTRWCRSDGRDALRPNRRSRQRWEAPPHPLLQAHFA